MLVDSTVGAAFGDDKREGGGAVISPSSTLDLLQMADAPAPPLAGEAHLVAEGPHHRLSIHAGTAYSSGSSALYEEGDCFIGHLGIGMDWGSPVETPTPVSLPGSESIAGGGVECYYNQY